MIDAVLVACPVCGRRQQKVPVGVTYIAVCGPTAGCGHTWRVGPSAYSRLVPLQGGRGTRSTMEGDQPVDNAAQPDEETLAEAVHEAYLTTCARLGWEVKPANRVPYAELSDDSKELDRASVRAVLARLAGGKQDVSE